MQSYIGDHHGDGPCLNKVAYTPVVVSKILLCLKTKASVQQGHLTLCGVAVLRVHQSGVHNTVHQSGVHNTVHHSGVYNAVHHSGVHNAVHHRRNFRRNISVAGFLGRAT